MTRLFLTLAIAVATLTGPAAAQKPVGTPFELGAGTSVQVGSEGLRIGFDRITGDSRCPTSVECIWQGVATAGLWAEAPGKDRMSMSLSTFMGLGFVRDGTFGQYRIRLLDVAPYPQTPGDIEPGRYIVSLVVTLNSLTTPSEESTWGAIKALYDR